MIFEMRYKGKEQTCMLREDKGIKGSGQFPSPKVLKAGENLAKVGKD